MNDLSAYHRYREKMDTGDLLQWHSDSIIGKLIRLRIGGDVNHSGLVLRVAQYEGEGRRWTTESLEGGVEAVLLSRRLEKFRGSVWWHPLKPAHQELRKVAGMRMLEMLGAPYDFHSLFRQIFSRVSVDLSSLFCSEYCYWCVGGEGEAPNPANLISTAGVWEEKGTRIL